ncbi:hypothetical protein ACDZ29_19890 [Peribacillus sp. RS7]|uniref:hypothetical protein n=1 Tax=Peribacillus sp. RS7 TaxID=3242679 RepID=UPI0035BEF348
MANYRYIDSFNVCRSGSWSGDRNYGVISIVSTTGLFGYVYNKQLLSKSFWKFVFIITVIEVLAYTMLDVLNDPELGVGGMIFVTAFTLIIMYPFFLGLYRYGFRKQNLA